MTVLSAEALLEVGTMRPAGLAEVEAAKADGRWEAAYASQRNAEPRAGGLVMVRLRNRLGSCRERL